MSNLTIEQYIAWLRANDVCEEAIVWSKRQADFAACYRDCANPEWLLWLLEDAGVLDDKRARLFGCWCVRTTPLADGRVVWDLLTDERSRAAVEVAERYAVGEATDGELSAAWTAAWSAAWSATGAAAWTAARSATGTAWSAAGTAWSAARSAAWIAQCARIREVWPVDEVAAAITSPNPTPTERNER